MISLRSTILTSSASSSSTLVYDVSCFTFYLTCVPIDVLQFSVVSSMCHVCLATIVIIKREIEMRHSMRKIRYASRIMGSLVCFQDLQSSIVHVCVVCVCALCTTCACGEISFDSCHLVPTNNLLPILDARVEYNMQIENGKPFNMVHRAGVCRQIKISTGQRNYCVLYLFAFEIFSSRLFLGPFFCLRRICIQNIFAYDFA